MPEGLSHRLGPFPVYVWVLILGGGLAVGVYLRHRSATTAAAVDTTAVDTGATGDFPTLGDINDGSTTANPGVPNIVVNVIMPATATKPKVGGAHPKKKPKPKHHPKPKPKHHRHPVHHHLTAGSPVHAPAPVQR